MKKTILMLFVLAIFSLVGNADEPMKVITTHETLRSLVEEVGGDKVEVHSLHLGVQDPHFTSAKPSFMALARRADLWVKIGMEMEIAYESLIIDGSRNRKIKPGKRGYLNVSVGVDKLEIPHKVDRSMGDVHAEGNPHYWLDPWNARIVAATIADRLIEMDPEHTEYFQTKLAKFHQNLDEAMFGKTALANITGAELWQKLFRQDIAAENYGGWLKAMAGISNNKLITFHKSWSYFANRFGLEVVIELEPKPGITPGPRHVMQVIKTAKQNRVKLIVLEPYYSRKSADTVSQRTGAMVKVIANSVGGNPRSKDYISMIDAIIADVTEVLK